MSAGWGIASDRRRQSRWIEIATGLAVIPIVIAIVAFYPPAREAVDGARRSVATLFGAGDWTGYYLELDPTARPDEVSSPQLLFTEGSFPGRGVRLVDPPVFAGQWSPSGEQFAFTSGRRLLIGDKRGEVRSLGELLDLTPEGPPLWVSENELLLTMGRRPFRGWWYVRVDASGLLLDQRALPTGLTIESVSSDGRFALGRSFSALVLVDLSDGTTTEAPAGLVYVGWLGDGRVLFRAIRSGLHRLEARAVGAGLGTELAEMRGPFDVSARGQWVVILERDRPDRSAASVWLIGPRSPIRRILTDVTGVTEAQPTADGRHVTFTTVSSDDARPRAGLLDVASGRITYACDEGCGDLRLR